MQPKLVSIVEAAKQLGVSRTTTYTLITAGKLRTVHVGRRALVPATEIERFIAELTGQRVAA